ncbi:barstar family protein [Streptomyces sp. NPDC086989]|uniref:barstar family protein n=1 Tax=Streptomyces sp. NPDC086989 TaxID=3365764 RepID=UPI003813B2C8
MLHQIETEGCMEFAAGIHDMTAADARLSLSAWADSGVRVFEVETGGATEKTAIIQAFASVVPTDPPTSGRSWDAFSDSLWEGVYRLEETRVAIVLRGECWVNQPHGDVRAALDVLQDVVTLLEDEKATLGRPTSVCVLLLGEA